MKNRLKTIKKEKGITLIALVITIVVLLLITGVSMSALTGENGVLTQAKAAKERTEIEEITEKIKTEIMGVQAANKGKITETELNAILAKYGLSTVEGEEKVLTTSKGYVINLSDIYAGIVISGNGNEEDDGIIEVPEEYVESYDISENGDGSITLYLVEVEGQPGKYEVLIIGEGRMKNYSGTYGRTEYQEYKESIISAKISEGITNITESTISGCQNLTDIKIPKSATDIYIGSFSGTAWMEERKKEKPLVIVNNVLIDGDTASGDIIIPNTVQTIAAYAFSGNTSIESIKMQEGVTVIGRHAFGGCTSLSNIEFAKSVETIEQNAFRECSGLTNIVIPENVKTIEGWSFYKCENLISVEISKSVITINLLAFNWCSNLKSIVVKKEEGSIEGAPWSASNATVTWEP